MKLVFTSIDYNKIKIIESTLSANGIKSMLKGEDLDVLNGIIPRNSNLLELYVQDGEFEDAISIIENNKIPDKVFEEDDIKQESNHKYEALRLISEKNDNIALYKLATVTFFVTTAIFLVLYLLEIDNFKKFYNATYNPNMDYYFSDYDNCLYETLEIKLGETSIFLLNVMIRLLELGRKLNTTILMETSLTKYLTQIYWNLIQLKLLTIFMAKKFMNIMIPIKMESLMNK
ncbi:putative signal transducing protein [Leptospira vanthielii]|uniref:PF09413 family protein n=1 Tax=Leptospira vanthielii serovar Holland str. Waz Holland = ATCC 700522 TaxID=1218591 RepID=N1W6S7_9LEPT|nr:DUF2007 domain-containing protein [Leptospira vanthielii]EMY69160.1 PF09413 family protein [Leptospira vanthielii serovar Holland str. Waz Holland = ATCC 700522]